MLQARKSWRLIMGLLALGLSATSLTAGAQNTADRLVTEIPIQLTLANVTDTPSLMEGYLAQNVHPAPTTDTFTSPLGGFYTNSIEAAPALDVLRPAQTASPEAAVAPTFAASNPAASATPDLRLAANNLRAMSSSGPEMGSWMVLTFLLVCYLMFHRLYGNLVLKR